MRCRIEIAVCQGAAKCEHQVCKDWAVSGPAAYNEAMLTPCSHWKATLSGKAASVSKHLIISMLSAIQTFTFSEETRFETPSNAYLLNLLTEPVGSAHQVDVVIANGHIYFSPQQLVFPLSTTSVRCTDGHIAICSADVNYVISTMWGVCKTNMHMLDHDVWRWDPYNWRCSLAQHCYMRQMHQNALYALRPQMLADSANAEPKAQSEEKKSDSLTFKSKEEVLKRFNLMRRTQKHSSDGVRSATNLQVVDGHPFRGPKPKYEILDRRKASWLDAQEMDDEGGASLPPSVSKHEEDTTVQGTA